MAPIIKTLLPDAELIHRPRFSTLNYAGSRKISRQPQRSAIVAFSAREVYAIAELIRRERGGAAVVMGALSPRTRNAQVDMYQNGDVDFLVATEQGDLRRKGIAEKARDAQGNIDTRAAKLGQR